jgi:hypothetical protein
MGVNSIGEIGLKITAAQREYFRYTGTSAELEQRGGGSSRADRAWMRRLERENERVSCDLTDGLKASRRG